MQCFSWYVAQGVPQAILKASGRIDYKNTSIDKDRMGIRRHFSS